METDRIVADIAARLARVEKSNRRLRLTLGGLVVAASSFVLVAAARQESNLSDEVRAKRFVVIGQNGETRAVLSTTNNAAALDLFAADAKSTDGDISLVASENGCELKLGTVPYARLATSTAKGRQRFLDALASRSDDEIPKENRETLTAVIEKMPIVLFQMGANVEDDAAALENLAAAAAGKRLRPGPVKFSVLLRSRDEVSVTGGCDNSSAFTLEASPSNGAVVNLNDESGNLRAILGNSTLTSPRTGVSESRPTSSLVFFDGKGQVLDRLPR